MSFGDNVRSALQERGVSIRAAAKALNYDHAYLSRVINGKQAPSRELAHAIDKFVGADGALAALGVRLDGDDVDRVRKVLQDASRLDAQAVKSLAGVLAAERRLDDTLGPCPLIPGARGDASSLRQLLRAARGPHRLALADVVAEWVQFEGWLHASAGNFGDAVPLLVEALDLADEAESPTLAAQALNFRGYIARQQRRPMAVARWFYAAYTTPGAHPAQRMGDAAQTAQGLAELGRFTDARRMLDEAAALADPAADQPPGTAYWLTPTFQRLNLGLAHLGLGDHDTAVDHLAAGLDGLPDDQRNAEWTVEYKDALNAARAGHVEVHVRPDVV
ncbi:helix-turn-helix domain-containing protein [Streptomyces sp. NBC_00525]|uniref:helix-turn-helix domain-containing protein n=1 Tax=Streptomyces sp. NBC_00525 TaxID=2903660 RepID=UPI002E8145BD|nr:helix-turn-helix transcriptional regulator [Streptomyces sp. NBC_00525]WUC97401.1 helix-turn-helix domain-containing protein [Streptomyces sp. NBC_00525]